MERNCQISVAGVAEDSRAKTFADIEQLLTVSEKVARSLSQPLKLAEIIVTDKFQETVNQLEQEMGAGGEYSSVRTDVRALGTTRKAELPDGDTQFIVIIDASQMEACDLTCPRSLAGNLDSPQAGVFLTSIIDGIVGVATYYMHHHAI